MQFDEIYSLSLLKDVIYCIVPLVPSKFNRWKWVKPLVTAQNSLNSLYIEFEVSFKFLKIE